MSSEPAVSVVMSVFNGERFVGKSIESILNQSMKDFEFIIIDDGSTDRSEEIVQRYRRLDHRIHVVARENRGLIQSLNEGISMANGKWIARMDADDISLPGRLRSQVDWLDQSRAELAGGAVKPFGYHYSRKWRYEASDDAIRLRLCFGTAFAHPSVMIRAKVAKENPYNREFKHAEDYELWTRLALKGVRMTNMPEVVLNYRVHNLQTSQQNKEAQASARERAQQPYIRSFTGNEGDFETMKKFSSPDGSPSLEDATRLFSILCNLTKIAPDIRLRLFSSVLKYVRPASPAVYHVAKRLAHQLGSPLPPNWSLLFQSYTQISTDTRAYNFFKRFV
jgi:glycosyltransferase involved in cell wall biosynthesis